ncbi:MAG: hypothetical protein MJ222_02705 [Bacilli bacterium]|nr:hypothetical protein [Bacilli bacterium]
MEKIIHYCWFGNGKKPRAIRKCISSWKKYYSDWKIIEWNESNFDLENACYYVKEAYKLRKFAFVADYVRCYVLYKYGGLYLDTDMKAIKKPTDEFINNDVLGLQGKGRIQTGLIKCSKESDLMRTLVSRFEVIDEKVIEAHINNFINEYFYDSLGHNFPDANYNAKGYLIYDSSYFIPKRYNWDRSKFQTKDTMFIHLFLASWKPENKKNRIKLQIFRFFCFLLGTERAYKTKWFLKGNKN